MSNTPKTSSSAKTVFGKAIVDNSQTINNIVNNYGLDVDIVRSLLGDTFAMLSQKIESNGQSVTDAIAKQISQVVGDEFVSAVCKLESNQKTAEQATRQLQINLEQLADDTDSFANGIYGKLQNLQSTLEDIELSVAALAKSSAIRADKLFKELLNIAVDKINAHTSQVVANAASKQITSLLDLLHEDIQQEYIDAQRIIGRCNELCKCAVTEDIANLCKFYITICGDNCRDKNKQLRTLEVQKYPQYITDILQLSIMFLSRDTILGVGGLIERIKNCRLLTTAQHSQWLKLYESEALKHKKDVYTVDKERAVFIAYKSEDIEKVEELCEYLESRGLECFVAARNLQKSVGGNYEELIKRAIDACKSIVFVSSRKSRAEGDAITIEFPYVIQADKTFALHQGEAFTSYETIPNYCKKPRAEFLIENYEKDEIIPYSVEAVFGGYTWIANYDTLAKYLFNEISNREVSIAAKRNKTSGQQTTITETTPLSKVDTQPVKQQATPVQTVQSKPATSVKQPEPVLTIDKLFAKGKELYDKGDYSNAIEYFIKAANKGHSQAQFFLGECFYYGKGVERNYFSAVIWYRKVAEREDADAQCSLGYCYEKGHGVDQNYSEAFKWYRKASAQGHLRANSLLNSLLKKIEKEQELKLCHTELAMLLRKVAIKKESQNSVIEQSKPILTSEQSPSSKIREENPSTEGENYQHILLEMLSEHLESDKKNDDSSSSCLSNRPIEDTTDELAKNGIRIRIDNHATAPYRTNSSQTVQQTPTTPTVKQLESVSTAEQLFAKGKEYYDKKDYVNAIKYFTMAANKDHAVAQYSLGDCYYFGFGVNRSYSEAVKWYRQAAEQENADAQCSLGSCYEKGHGVNQNYEEAFKLYRKASAQGHKLASSLLNSLFKRVVIEKKSPSKSSSRLSDCPKGIEDVADELAKNGIRIRIYNHATAPYRTNSSQTVQQTPATPTKQPEPVLTAEQLFVKGEEYYEKKDYDNAVKFYFKAAEQGHIEAQYSLGCYYERWGAEDYPEAIKWYRKAAEKGHTEAQYNLGVLYHAGWGCDQNSAEAVKWFSKAAQKGHRRAEEELALCLYEGDGVVQNFAAAVQLFQKRAEYGEPRFKCYLGDCYYYGRGVKKDYTEAVKWYLKANEYNYLNNNLGDCYYYGRGVKKDYCEAFRFYKKAADTMGDIEAMYNLANCYYYGIGVKKDRDSAHTCYVIAAGQGHILAKKKIKWNT